MKTVCQVKGQKMTLVDGEEILIAMNSICQPHTVLVRVGDNLVAGVCYDRGNILSYIYLWHKVDGVYCYLGDVGLTDNHDGSVLLGVTPANGVSGSEANRKALELRDTQTLETARILQLQKVKKLRVDHSGFQKTSFSFLAATCEATLPNP